MKSDLHGVVDSAPDLAPTTRDKYLRDLNAWVDFAGAHPRGWTPARAQEFYTALITRGLKPQSANRLMASVAYASKWWATSQGRPELDFVRIRQAKAKDKGARRALSEAEATALIRACAGPSPFDLRDLAIIIMFLETGMRVMSLISMEPQTTDPGSKTSYVAMKGHGAERLAVPLSDTAVAALRPWMNWVAGRAHRAMFCPIQYRLSPAGRGITPIDRPICDSTIAKIVTERAARAQIGHLHPHIFRHTFVTWRVAAGYAPHEISAMTRHTISGIGALAGYMDVQSSVITERIRTSTPGWLAELVGASVQ